MANGFRIKIRNNPELKSKMIDQKRFNLAKEKIVGQDRERNGIGTLSEKTVHAVLKNYYAPDESTHEISVGGCVADICTGEEILEIQTRSFDRLREKLDRFLPLCPVTIIYPIPHEKRLIWIDEETGELSAPRKSPLTGNPYMAFKELYRIRRYLLRDGLRLKLVLLDMEEYRLLNGWSRDKKKGSTRFDRIPPGSWRKCASTARRTICSSSRTALRSPLPSGNSRRRRTSETPLPSPPFPS